MKDAPATQWRRLWPLAGVVLAVHLALLPGSWQAMTPTRDRWVQHFSTRTISVARPETPPSPSPPTTAPKPPAGERKPGPPPVRKASATLADAPAPAAVESQGETDRASAPALPPASRFNDASPAQEPATGVTPFVPQALGIPQPSALRYEATLHARGFTALGEARLDWWHDGQRYDLRLTLSAPGLRERVQHSAGQITDEGLAPERFSDKSRVEQATHFDRARGRIVFSNNRPEAALVAGMQDRLSVLVQLSMLVAGEPGRFTPGTQLVLPTASTREADDWLLRVIGEEELDLPGGRLNALKLERLPRREYDQKIELWLAPGMDYAPVRLRLTNPDGGSVDQRWASTDRG